MAEVVPADRWVKGAGPRGTIVFAYTHGYPQGGPHNRDLKPFVWTPKIEDIMAKGGRGWAALDRTMTG